MTTDANSLYVICKQCGLPIGQNFGCSYCQEYIKQETQRLASLGMSSPIPIENQKARLERIATQILAGMMACPTPFFRVGERTDDGMTLEESYAIEAILYAKALIEAIEKEGK